MANNNVFEELKDYINNNKTDIKSNLSNVIENNNNNYDNTKKMIINEVMNLNTLNDPRQIKELQFSFEHTNLDQVDNFHASTLVTIKGLRFISNLPANEIEEKIKLSVIRFYDLANMQSKDIPGLIKFINKQNPDLEVLSIDDIQFELEKTMEIDGPDM